MGVCLRKRLSSVSPKQFREGMRRFAGACTIVTSHLNGKRAGVTATAICSMTADPPRILVCVNRGCHAHRAIDTCHVVVVNVLASQHQELAKRFAGLTVCRPSERFADGAWIVGELGAPVLRDALVNLECEVIEQLQGSTHSLFVCEVVHVRMDERPSGTPLLYCAGSFASLAATK